MHIGFLFAALAAEFAIESTPGNEARRAIKPAGKNRLLLTRSPGHPPHEPQQFPGRPLTPTQGLPKPATNQFPQKSFALRATWRSDGDLERRFGGSDRSGVQSATDSFGEFSHPLGVKGIVHPFTFISRPTTRLGNRGILHQPFVINIVWKGCLLRGGLERVRPPFS